MKTLHGGHQVAIEAYFLIHADAAGRATPAADTPPPLTTTPAARILADPPLVTTTSARACDL